ncbi:MAG: thioredoxin [Clostridia bacterium]|nr:thioredoxin [Clostridia bacterium]
MSIIHVTAENFEDSVLKNDKPVILDFYADWCGPCRMLGPVLEKVAAEHEELAVAKVNVDDVPSLAESFGVTSIPALFVLRNGEVVNQAVGFMPKEKVLELVK